MNNRFIDRVHNGDSLSAMSDIEDESVDMILTDPPYGTTYCEWDGVLKNMDRFKKSSVFDLDMFWGHCMRVIKPNGAIVVTASQPFTTVLIASNMRFYKFGYVWKKNKAGNHVVVRYQPLKVHEDVVVFSKGGANTGASVPIKYHPQGVKWGEQTRTRKNDIKASGTYRYNSLRSGEYTVQGTGYPQSILEFALPPKSERIHPTQKPVDMFEYLIRTFSDEGDVILDPFSGSATTAISAINTGRHYIAYEKDVDMWRKGNERLTNYVGLASGDDSASSKFFSFDH